MTSDQGTQIDLLALAKSRKKSARGSRPPTRSGPGDAAISAMPSSQTAVAKSGLPRGGVEAASRAVAGSDPFAPIWPLAGPWGQRASLYRLLLSLLLAEPARCASHTRAKPNQQSRDRCHRKRAGVNVRAQYLGVDDEATGDAPAVDLRWKAEPI